MRLPRTGTDIIDKEAAKQHGIAISNIRNYAFNTVPEHVIALMSRSVATSFPYARDVASGVWSDSRQFCFFPYPIHDIAGSTLGIAGYGVLGKSIANAPRRSA